MNETLVTGDWVRTLNGIGQITYAFIPQDEFYILYPGWNEVAISRTSIIEKIDINDYPEVQL